MRWRFGLMLAVGLGAVLPGMAVAKQTITMGAIADPAYEASLWAISNGKVSDPEVEFKIDYMPIPAAIQAALTRQYNIIGDGILSVVQMVQNGIPVKILGTEYRYNPSGHANDLWVLKDSPIKSVADLKGKTIAVSAVQAQNVISLRTVLQERYHMNAAAIGGDFRFVAIPSSQFAAALQEKRVDAAVFGNVAAYMAAKSDKYRSVLQGAKELNEMFGGPMPSVVMLAYEPDLTKREKLYVAAAKLLKRSADYVLAHPDEVFPVVAKKYKMDAHDLQVWFTTYGEMPNALGATDGATYVKVWEAGKKLGVLNGVPSLDSLLWTHAVPE